MFDILINDDNIQENSESFNLTISVTSLSNQVDVGSPSMVTIEDNDGKYYISDQNLETLPSISNFVVL